MKNTSEKKKNDNKNGMSNDNCSYACTVCDPICANLINILPPSYDKIMIIQMKYLTSTIRKVWVRVCQKTKNISDHLALLVCFVTMISKNCPKSAHFQVQKTGPSSAPI